VIVIDVGAGASSMSVPVLSELADEEQTTVVAPIPESPPLLLPSVEQSLPSWELEVLGRSDIVWFEVQVMD
jgi:hypothetical protein